MQAIIVSTWRIFIAREFCGQSQMLLCIVSDEGQGIGSLSAQSRGSRGLSTRSSQYMQRAITAENALGTEREALVHRALAAKQAACALIRL